MIALNTDYLLFQLSDGQSMPFSPEMLTVEFIGPKSAMDSDFIRNAANAVVYYFKHELKRQVVTVSEFAAALGKVLRGFSPELNQGEENGLGVPVIVEANLEHLMYEDGAEGELFFLPRLREELRAQLRLDPRELRLSGFRECVKSLAGARRWTSRCSALSDEIVDFLRRCLSAEVGGGSCAVLLK